MIVVTGTGGVVADGPLDPTPHLKSRKSRKFMGVQDDLAVLAAAAALARAGLRPTERVGLFGVVGYIPFAEEDIAPVLAGSLEDQRFSMRRFAEVGFRQAHPLLTFRCLPNMPVYHVSVNLDFQGPYLVTYPGPGQLYAALEEAAAALADGTLDAAVVMAVAHQRNFLVAHHFARITPPVGDLRDVGACVVLERAGARAVPPLLKLEQLAIGYEPFDPTGVWPSESESFSGGRVPDGALGPAALLLALDAAAADRSGLEHHLRTRDGISARSVWTRGDWTRGVGSGA